VKYALEDVRAREGRVVPLCPFFASYIKRHPEYEDLVDHEMTMEFKKRQKRS
jgi:predicted GNAT family acetyltransferase